MRLTKQLKAQVNSIKFASQIPTNSSIVLNHHVPSTTTTTTTTTAAKTTTTEASQPLILSNKLTVLDSNSRRKTSTIITTSQSDNYLTNVKSKSNVQRYNFEDNDSLNSNFLQEEQQIML